MLVAILARLDCQWASLFRLQMSDTQEDWGYPTSVCVPAARIWVQFVAAFESCWEMRCKKIHLNLLAVASGRS